ncbi:30S ribosomal protein S15 [Candidatus Aerophobetes bacterium]|uniref:Small ribosomal subunit protein uS15 n=1 Tax=Aerophobetes bacterium TaxID=2030807 RepID=A0A523T9Y6_UNCAE|nr:MAG: 30S ribosomal protein S15 [Candidatus Aerophobetes bacterium]
MSIGEVKKKEIQEKFRLHEKDTGSTPLQIAVLTERISNLSAHLAQHKKDQGSKRGLLQLVARRRKLLDYLRREDKEKYKKIIKDLGLRR